MTFRKREKVVYPVHGAGKVVDIFEQDIDGEKREYYKLEFFKSPVSISVPVDNAEELGLRSITSERSLRSHLKDLGSKTRLHKNTISNLKVIAEEKINSGKIEDAVELINLMWSFSQKLEDDGESLSRGLTVNLETAVNFLCSEVEVVLGKKAVDKYCEEFMELLG